jgi:ATP-dependent DNA ligase
MPLGRRREPFDHPDWLLELKWDGFRTLAHVTGGGSKFVSRNGNAFRGFPDLASELALEVNADTRFSTVRSSSSTPTDAHGSTT